jgi:hypothetical protein
VRLVPLFGTKSRVIAMTRSPLGRALPDLSTSQPAGLIVIDSGKQTTMISVHEDTSQEVI